jgi:hypothetical protein
MTAQWCATWFLLAYKTGVVDALTLVTRPAIHAMVAAATDAAAAR